MLPRKLQKGSVFKDSVVDAVNGIVDYLEKIRLVPGPGIRLQQMSNGTVISAPSTPIAPGSSGGGAPASSYDGYFTVIEIAGTSEIVGKLKIVDGKQPSSLYAGRLDIGYVPVMEIERKIGMLYLIVTYDQGSYKFALSYSSPVDGVSIGEALAEVLPDGKLVQRWTLGEIKFRNGYFL